MVGSAKAVKLGSIKYEHEVDDASLVREFETAVTYCDGPRVGDRVEHVCA